MSAFAICVAWHRARIIEYLFAAPIRDQVLFAQNFALASEGKKKFPSLLCFIYLQSYVCLLQHTKHPAHAGSAIVPVFFSLPSRARYDACFIFAFRFFDGTQFRPRFHKINTILLLLLFQLCALKSWRCAILSHIKIYHEQVCIRGIA